MKQNIFKFSIQKKAEEKENNLKTLKSNINNYIKCKQFPQKTPLKRHRYKY